MKKIKVVESLLTLFQVESNPYIALNLILN